MDRRAFTDTVGAAAIALACGPRLSTLPEEGGSDKLGRIGLQLYTVRGEMRRDFEGTLARVGAIGYKEVEFAGYFGRTPQQVKAALDAAGLVAPATHLDLAQLAERWDQTLEATHVIGCRYCVVPWIAAEQRRTLDGWREVARQFNAVAARAHRAGLRFAYHNHDFEFPPVEGRVPFDLLLAETDPATVELELDLYWITKAGGDPFAYFARYPGRFPMVHVKDMAADGSQSMVDVGKGGIDFRRIFARRKQAGVEHFFVEHDQPASPFDSIQASYDHLKRLEF